MSNVKKLITEIHHRSLWQVLLIYIGAAWACFELIATVADTVGLPGWLPGLAIVLFLLGLPFVIATALVREEAAPLPAEDAATAERVPVEADREATERRRRFLTWRNGGLSFLVALAVWGVIAAGWMLLGGGEAETGAVAEERPSVAALPFVNRSGLEEDEYFTDGIHDEILTQLYKISGLSVRGRTSVMEYRDSPKNLRQISEELNARFLLEGGVLRAGEAVRINVQLIDAEQDEHVWAETYDRPLSAENLLAVQSEVALRVADALRTTLTIDEVERIEGKPTNNLEAYDYYLRGRYAGGNRLLAEEMYQKAVELDSTFALAHASLSRVHTNMFFQSDDRTDERLAKARAAADKALALEPDLPEAHYALGYYYLNGIRAYEQALEEFSTVLKLAPNHAGATDMMGLTHRRRGEWELAVAYNKKAAELNPRSADIGEDLPISYMWLRDFEAAESLWNGNIALAPDRGLPYVFKAWTHLNQEDGKDKAWQVLETGREKTGFRLLGLTWVYFQWPLLRSLHEHYRPDLRRLSLETAGVDTTTYYLLKALSFRLTDEAETSGAYYDSACVELERRMSESPNAFRLHGRLGIAYAGLGRKGEAIREAQAAVELLPVSRDHLLGPFNVATLAEVYAMVGEYDAAIDQLEYLLSIPFPMSPPLLRADPLWDPLRDHPRFQALLER
jgi:serine/threonine-protein kinase